MFGIILLWLGCLDSDRYERVAVFFIVLGRIEANLIERHTRLYSLFGFLIVGSLRSFAEGIVASGITAEVTCGELRLYTICPSLWNKYMARGRICGHVPLDIAP